MYSFKADSVDEQVRAGSQQLRKRRADWVAAEVRYSVGLAVKGATLPKRACAAPTPVGLSSQCLNGVARTTVLHVQFITRLHLPEDLQLDRKAVSQAAS